jgi:hypothetical protein
MVRAMTKPQATPDRTRKPAVHQGMSATSATRIVVATFGVLVSLAGIEHGVGEVLRARSAHKDWPSSRGRTRRPLRSWVGSPP